MQIKDWHFFITEALAKSFRLLFQPSVGKIAPVLDDDWME